MRSFTYLPSWNGTNLKQDNGTLSPDNMKYLKQLYIELTTGLPIFGIYIFLFFIPVIVLSYIFPEIGTENQENGKAFIGFIACILCTPITIFVPMYLIEKTNEKLGV